MPHGEYPPISSTNELKPRIVLGRTSFRNQLHQVKPIVIALQCLIPDDNAKPSGYPLRLLIFATQTVDFHPLRAANLSNTLYQSMIGMDELKMGLPSVLALKSCSKISGLAQQQNARRLGSNLKEGGIRSRKDTPRGGKAWRRRKNTSRGHLPVLLCRQVLLHRQYMKMIYQTGRGRKGGRTSIVFNTNQLQPRTTHGVRRFLSRLTPLSSIDTEKQKCGDKR